MMLLGAFALSLLLQVTNFAGEWTVDAPPTDMGSGLGSPLTITQDAGKLTIDQVLFSRYDLQPPVRTVYALDGSESRNAVMSGHATQLRVSRARWDGASLRISTTYPAVDPSTKKAFTVDVEHTLTLEGAATLVIETTRGGALGGKPVTTRAVYRKKS
jgi:hypothetical protein